LSRPNLINQIFKATAPNKVWLGDSLIVHTDQGSQYTSSRYQSTLRQVGAQSSMSRKGNPYDNAMMESFYKTLKRELINDAHFETRAEATQEIFK
ncbi:DDE-type integrase/transposase/recombinase, partial [Streptococcus pneumoniae]|uniref:DDE-type integrase/transposase/recombinase n=1 Tax=Streptococcus pneumoniae TaxID=1313 RepID=UPI0011564ADC